MNIIVGFDDVLLGKQLCCILHELLDTKDEGTRDPLKYQH